MANRPDLADGPHPDASGLPARVSEFIEEADERVREFIREQGGHPKGFVSSDFVTVYAVLSRVAQERLAPGPRFCEWGSGFGAVASLASMLEFEAYGIEIQPDLVEAAQALAADFDLDVTFVHGSFLPPEAEEVTHSAEFAWWDRIADNGYEELEIDLEDFDLFFAYPWPGEEDVVDTLFARYASVGALLITYHGVSGTRIQRKLDTEPTVKLLTWD